MNRRHVIIGVVAVVLVLWRCGPGNGSGGTSDRSQNGYYASLAAGSGCKAEMNYVCRGSGLEYATGEGGRVSTVFLYNQGADGFQAFTGELPAGLSWRDTRADVERRLGAPESVRGSGEIGVWLNYPDRGLTIFLNTPDPTDMSAFIHHIAIKIL